MVVTSRASAKGASPLPLISGRMRATERFVTCAFVMVVASCPMRHRRRVDAACVAAPSTRARTSKAEVAVVGRVSEMGGWRGDNDPSPPSPLPPPHAMVGPRAAGCTCIVPPITSEEVEEEEEAVVGVHSSRCSVWVRWGRVCGWAGRAVALVPWTLCSSRMR